MQVHSCMRSSIWGKLTTTNSINVSVWVVSCTPAVGSSLLAWLGDAITDVMGIMCIPLHGVRSQSGLAHSATIKAVMHCSRQPVGWARRLSSCSFCHYGNGAHLVAPQSTYSNATGEEHQHYFNCALHHGENRVSRVTEEEKMGWRTARRRGTARSLRSLSFLSLVLCLPLSLFILCCVFSSKAL